MLQQDYLLRLIMRLVEAMTKSLHRSKDEDDPLGAAELLEMAIGDATDIDGSVLLSLAPESIASILQVSGTDPRVAGYVARSLKLEADFLEQGGQPETSALRLAQAKALASAYGVDLDEPIEQALDPEAIDKATVEDIPAPELDLSAFGVSFDD